ncbi:MAG: HAD family hydrolase [Prolixibacteraceae bacterium]
MNTNRKWLGLWLLIIVLAVWTYSYYSDNYKDPLPSWNDTPLKEELKDYMVKVVDSIPVEDRIAVFDLDGTLACESPLWFEMLVAVQGLVDQVDQDPSLQEETIYEYALKLAENPADTSVTNHWVKNGVNYIDSMILNAFHGMDCEQYVVYARSYLDHHKDRKYGQWYRNMFYPPMLELVEWLQKYQFKVYVVSGSMQGVLWSICPQTLELDRAHLIGTRQAQVPVYQEGKQASFVLQNAIFEPKNNNNGKSLNIYSHIGKIPVIAVGNTTGDFGMFHLASSSKYPHLSLLINHDDAEREYAYPPYHGTAVPAWRDSLRINKWLKADMSKEFKVMWKK